MYTNRLSNNCYKLWYACRFSETVVCSTNGRDVVYIGVVNKAIDAEIEQGAIESYNLPLPAAPLHFAVDNLSLTINWQHLLCRFTTTRSWQNVLDRWRIGNCINSIFIMYNSAEQLTYELTIDPFVILYNNYITIELLRVPPNSSKQTHLFWLQCICNRCLTHTITCVRYCWTLA